jgi:adenine/guanine phosphoribosyltransferase-like PRPP-binding protein
MGDGLTLSALLAHPRHGGLGRVAGDERTWLSAVVENDEDALPATADRALAILVAGAPRAPWQLDALLRRVRDRGFTGLVLPDAAVVHESAAVADRLGIALLVVDRPWQLARTCWELLEQHDAMTLSLVRRVAQSIEYHADDLSDLLRHVAANLGYGVALVDRAGVLVGAGPEPAPEVLAAISFTGWADTVRVGTGACASVRVESPSREGLRIVVHGPALTDAQLAALTTVAEVVMPMVAARLLLDEVATVSDVSRASGLLSDFLEQKGAPEPDVERRMRERGWRTSGFHVGFRMQARGRLDPFDLVRVVSRELGTMPTDSHVTTRGRGVLGWLSFADRPAPADLQRGIAQLRGLHASVQDEFPVATGVGSLQEGAPGLVATLGEAADAARLATSRSSAGWFLHIDRLGLEQLLLAWTGHDTFLPTATALLAPLTPAETATLAAYLDHESQVAATAAALGVHRNTVTGRMQRIQRALGIDLDDPDARLAVHLACRAVSPGG